MRIYVVEGDKRVTGLCCDGTFDYYQDFVVTMIPGSAEDEQVLRDFISRHVPHESDDL